METIVSYEIGTHPVQSKKLLAVLLFAAVVTFMAIMLLQFL